MARFTNYKNWVKRIDPDTWNERYALMCELNHRGDGTWFDLTKNSDGSFKLESSSSKDYLVLSSDDVVSEFYNYVIREYADGFDDEENFCSYHRAMEKDD